MKCEIVSTFLLTLTTILIVQGDIQCDVKEDKCSCASTNFTLSLRFAFPNGHINFTNKEDGSSVVISPCEDFTCGTRASRGCQWDANGDAFVVLGTAKDVVWSVQKEDDFMVTFADGDPTYDKSIRNTQVLGKKSNSGTNVKYDGESGSNPLVYGFTVSAISFAPSSGSEATEAPVGIVGLVLMILLFVGLVAYFIIGGVVMYTVKGARGVEVFPNYLFWKDLPFLIKDGFVFTFGPCVSRVSNKGSYSAL